MSDADDKNPEPGAEPADAAARMRERLLAYHCGALEEDEAALIRGRLESDLDWQRASAEAKKMLSGLEVDGKVDAPVPAGLGERAMRRVKDSETPESEPFRSKYPRRDSQTKQSDAPSPPFFTARMAAAIFILCALPAVWMALKYMTSTSAGESIRWQAERDVAAGGPFAPNLIVRDSATQKPVRGVRLAAYLLPAAAGGSAPIPIGEGETGAAGVVDNAAWTVPDVPAGDYRLAVEARSRFGAVLDRAERAVKVSRSARLALSPDRTQARPGETIRARALLVSNAGEKPVANQAVTLDLFDPAGNRIGRTEMSTTAFGLAWAEFPLDSAAPEGAYTLKAAAAGLNAERGVEVKQYTLPPFRVSIAPDRPWFALRDRIAGKIAAQTFDGHALAKARGELRLLDAAGKVLRRAEIVCDAEGRADFDLDEIGGAREDLAQLRLSATLTDAAGRSASGRAAIGVGVSPVAIVAVPEAGELVPGVENRVYIVARGADGAPVRTRLSVSRDTREAADLETDAHGVAVYTLRDPKAPAEVLRVSPDYKNAPPQNLSLPVRAREKGALLVRTERAVLKAGQALKISVLAGRPEDFGGAASVVLALRQDGRTVAAGGVILKDGKGEATLAIPAGVSGTLSVEASLPSAQWSDTRMIAVSGSERVRIVASADKASYRPGDRARLNFAVTDAGGAGIPAAVSVVGVDDALLAMTGEHPGLAQGLQAAGVNVFRRPDVPLDPERFSPEQGGEDGALAALAAVRPVTREAMTPQLQQLITKGFIQDHKMLSDLQRIMTNPSSDYERETRASIIEQFKDGGVWEQMKGVFSAEASSGEMLIDTSGEKSAALKAERHQLAAQLGQWVLALVGIAAALGILLGVAASRKQSIRNAVPVTTVAMTIIGLLAGSWLEPNTGVFLIVLSFTLMGVHAVLLYRGEGPDHLDSNLSQMVVCIVTDPALIFLGFLTAAQRYNQGAYVVFLILASLGAAAMQWDTGRPREKRFGLVFSLVAVLFVLAGLVLPVLARARESARRTSMASLANQVVKAEMMFEDMLPTLAVPASLPTPGSSSTPRLRWDFPETMIFAPQIVTDETGRASFDLAVADSLTSWRVQADAIAAAGGTAWTDARLVVTQPFSVDLTLPTDVTAGDVLHVPAVVSNHSDIERVVDVALNLSGAKALDGPSRQVRVGAKAVASVEFAVRFDEPGLAVLTCNAVSAGAARESDSVQRALSVAPDGMPVAFAASALIGAQGELAVHVPDDALPGTVRASLRLHRGPLTQMLEGMESMLQEPHGCFEQTSSSTYPNIMILRYLKANGANKPEIEKLAKDYIARGYQRLLGFEVGGKSGSFSLYGQAPASAFLTAYGLLEFSDMDKVAAVDPALLARMRAWLRAQMNADGSFRMDAYQVHERSPNGLAGTAYVALALGSDAPRESIDLLRRNRIEIEKSGYLCALAANALLPHDRATAGQLAGKLRGLAQFTEAKAVGTKTAVLAAGSTLAWGHGDAAAVEASALGVLALLESGTDMELAQQLLAGIQARAGNRFGFGSTHATVLALKALERASGSGRKAGPARIVALVNGKPLQAIDLPAEESAKPVSVALDLPRGISTLQIQCDGGPVAARVVGQASVPWAAAKAPAGALRAGVRYDAKEVQRGQAVLGTLELSAQQRNAEVPMVEWGIPAGFVAESEDLNAMKAKGTLSRWEMSGRSLRLYAPDLNAGKSATFAVRFYATAKGELKARAGRAYEYYRGEEGVALEPASFSVK